jgi:hypothetical protein
VKNISRCGRARRWSGREKSREHEEESGGVVRRLGERQQLWSAASSSTSCVAQEEEERRKRKEKKEGKKGEACLSKELGCSRQMDWPRKGKKKATQAGPRRLHKLKRKQMGCTGKSICWFIYIYIYIFCFSILLLGFLR